MATSVPLSLTNDSRACLSLSALSWCNNKTNMKCNIKILVLDLFQEAFVICQLCSFVRKVRTLTLVNVSRYFCSKVVAENFPFYNFQNIWYEIHSPWQVPKLFLEAPSLTQGTLYITSMKSITRCNSWRKSKNKLSTERFLSGPLIPAIVSAVA